MSGNQVTVRLERCGNCGREIGRMEQAHLFEGEVVCATCIKKLASGVVAVSASAPPPPAPAPQVVYVPQAVPAPAPSIHQSVNVVLPVTKGGGAIATVGVVFSAIALTICWLPLMFVNCM